MLRILRRYRPWILILAIWLTIEPLVVTMLRAQEIPSPVLDTNKIDGLTPIDEIMTPTEYLDYLLELRGASKQDAEAKAWGDWLMTMAGIYMMMDVGNQDVFSFYATMKVASVSPVAINGAAITLKQAANKANLLFSFLSKVAISVRGANIYRGWARMTKNLETAMGKNRTFKFLEFMAPPPYWTSEGMKLWKISSAEAKSGAGFKSYYRWVKKTTGGNPGRGNTISNVKGAARTCGIGLTVLSMVLAGWHISDSDDQKSGNLLSYDLVKSYADIILGAGTLIAMFCVPIVGQVVAVLTLIWFVASIAGDAIGEHNKKWKEAYKNSYWFLYKQDPKFRSYYDNRAYLKPAEKAASLLVAETEFRDVLNAQNPLTDQEKEQYKRGQAVWEALEKQGVLMTYYGQTGFSLPDYDFERLQDLWQKKADYMGWKPNEQEEKEAKNRGFFGTLGHVVNPMTYVSWIGDKISSQRYQNEIKNNDIQRVYFNPDYILVKKYQNYLVAKNCKGGIYDIVGLRMEQSPFNYIPLVGIDTTAWNESLINQSFNADSFIIGSMEMKFFREQAKAATSNLEEVIKEGDELVSQMEKEDLPHTRILAEALMGLADAYQSAPDALNDEVYEKCHNVFGWNWNNNAGEKTPRNMINRYKASLEQTLAYTPLSVGQKAADLVLLVQSYKHNLDTAKMMENLVQEKESALDMEKFKKEFSNAEIQEYLKTGTFLNVKGKTFSDWLGGLIPPYEDLDKCTKLYKQETAKFSSFANRAVTNSRDGFLGIDYTVKPPQDLLKEFNDELKELKKVSEAFYEIKDSAGLSMPVSKDNAEVYDGIYGKGDSGINHPDPKVGNLEPINLDEPVPPTEDIFLPTCPPMNQN